MLSFGVTPLCAISSATAAMPAIVLNVKQPETFTKIIEDVATARLIFESGDYMNGVMLASNLYDNAERVQLLTCFSKFLSKTNYKKAAAYAQSELEWAQKDYPMTTITSFSSNLTQICGAKLQQHVLHELSGWDAAAQHINNNNMEEFSEIWLDQFLAIQWPSQNCKTVFNIYILLILPDLKRLDLFEKTMKGMDTASTIICERFVTCMKSGDCSGIASEIKEILCEVNKINEWVIGEFEDKGLVDEIDLESAKYGIRLKKFLELLNKYYLWANELLKTSENKPIKGIKTLESIFDALLFRLANLKDVEIRTLFFLFFSKMFASLSCQETVNPTESYSKQKEEANAKTIVASPSKEKSPENSVVYTLHKMFSTRLQEDFQIFSKIQDLIAVEKFPEILSILGTFPDIPLRDFLLSWIHLKGIEFQNNQAASEAFALREDDILTESHEEQLKEITAHTLLNQIWNGKAMHDKDIDSLAHNLIDHTLLQIQADEKNAKFMESFRQVITYIQNIQILSTDHVSQILLESVGKEIKERTLKKIVSLFQERFQVVEKIKGSFFSRKAASAADSEFFEGIDTAYRVDDDLIPADDASSKIYFSIEERLGKEDFEGAWKELTSKTLMMSAENYGKAIGAFINCGALDNGEVAYGYADDLLSRYRSFKVPDKRVFWWTEFVIHKIFTYVNQSLELIETFPQRHTKVIFISALFTLLRKNLKMSYLKDNVTQSLSLISSNDSK